jgi:hypothetical protein
MAIVKLTISYHKSCDDYSNVKVADKTQQEINTERVEDAVTEVKYIDDYPSAGAWADQTRPYTLVGLPRGTYTGPDGDSSANDSSFTCGSTCLVEDVSALPTETAPSKERGPTPDICRPYFIKVVPDANGRADYPDSDGRQPEVFGWRQNLDRVSNAVIPNGRWNGRLYSDLTDFQSNEQFPTSDPDKLAAVYDRPVSNTPILSWRGHYETVTQQMLDSKDWKTDLSKLMWKADYTSADETVAYQPTNPPTGSTIGAYYPHASTVTEDRWAGTEDTPTGDVWSMNIFYQSDISTYSHDPSDDSAVGTTEECECGTRYSCGDIISPADTSSCEAWWNKSPDSYIGAKNHEEGLEKVENLSTCSEGQPTCYQDYYCGTVIDGILISEACKQWKEVHGNVGDHESYAKCEESGCGECTPCEDGVLPGLPQSVSSIAEDDRFCCTEPTTTPTPFEAPESDYFVYALCLQNEDELSDDTSDHIAVKLDQGPGELADTKLYLNIAEDDQLFKQGSDELLEGCYGASGTSYTGSEEIPADTTVINYTEVSGGVDTDVGCCGDPHICTFFGEKYDM